jgi:nucleoside-diphosphate-sugar epimerase
MILVTGGCGFIGSEVVRQLVARGDEVRVADNLSKPYAKVPDGCEFMHTDLTEPQQASAAFADVTHCINLAAKIGGIGYFHRWPATILSENAKIYSTTFDGAVDAHLERMLFVSSSMVYESAERFPSREEDVPRLRPPHTAYGFSKLMGEWFCRAFAEQYQVPFTIIRPFNAFGPGEKAGEEVGEAHVIPDLVKKIQGGQYPVELLGDGEQTRCFTHVRDIARGIIMALDSPRAVNEDFNLSSPEEITMRDLAERIFRLCHPGRPFETVSVPGFPSDIRRRVPDTSKARELLGFQAEISLDEGLREVLAS